MATLNPHCTAPSPTLFVSLHSTAHTRSIRSTPLGHALLSQRPDTVAAWSPPCLTRFIQLLSVPRPHRVRRPPAHLCSLQIQPINLDEVQSDGFLLQLEREPGPVPHEGATPPVRMGRDAHDAHVALSAACAGVANEPLDDTPQ